MPIHSDDRVDLVDEERPARQVERDLHERFVERHERVGEPAHAGLVAERLLERGAEHDADVFDRVVQVDLEVAVGLDREVEPGVLAELFEHVVEERDAGRRRRVAGAVDVEREVDRRLLGLAVLFATIAAIMAATSSERPRGARRGTRRSRRACRP